MEHEPIVETFSKDVIQRRLQLPRERIEVLIDECGTPTDDEEKYAQWFADHFERILEELKLYGPIAQMQATHPSGQTSATT